MARNRGTSKLKQFSPVKKQGIRTAGPSQDSGLDAVNSPSPRAVETKRARIIGGQGTVTEPPTRSESPSRSLGVNAALLVDVPL
jgi:hypothetical protein